MLARARAIVLVVAASLAASALALFWNGWAVDLSAIYFAARSYGLDQAELIYLSHPEFFGGTASPEWAQMAADLGHAGQPALPYIYPPIWAAVLSPIATNVGPIAFFNGVMIVHIAALIGSIFLSHRLFARSVQIDPRWWIASGAVILTCAPFYLGFWLGQPHILVTFLILLGFERYGAGRVIAAGIILGFAAALKLSPLVFGLIFVMDRNWKAASAMALTGLALLGASVAITGLPLHFEFWDQLGRMSAHMIITPLNFSLDAIAFRLTDLLTGADISADNGYAIVQSPLIFRALGLAALGASIAVIWWRFGRMDPKTRLPRTVLALWAASTLCAPLAWSHYLIGPLLMLTAMVLARPSMGRAIGVGVVLILTSNLLHLGAVTQGINPLWLMSAGGIALAVIFVVALVPAKISQP